MRATTQLCGKTAIRENSHKKALLSILASFEMDYSLLRKPLQKVFTELGGVQIVAHFDVGC